LTSLLAQSQKALDKPFSLTWHAATGDGSQYVLSVVNFSAHAQKDRRGWSSSAIDNSGVGVAEWKLHHDVDGKRTEVFSVHSSDAYLVQSVIEEALMEGAAPGKNQPLGSSSLAAPAAQSGEGSQSTAAAAAAPAAEKSAFLEGNLRQVSPRKLMENYNTTKTTGRLICDIGTVTSEVFFTDGEPVHAKSCHSIYGDRDKVGDEVIIDLLTWKEGDFKFQDKWPAASHTVTQSMEAFLSGTASSASAADHSEAASSSSSSAATSSSAAPASKAAAPIPRSTASSPSSPDDFSNTDEIIGDTYLSMIEASGLLKYGMFLMLARTEFARFEVGKVPFCVAAIGLGADVLISDEALGKIGECFEPVGQPLDILAYASRTRLYALFPHSTCATAATSLKHFINNVQSTALESGLHGSNIRITIGICEVPRDGADFQQIFEDSCKLRRAATPNKKIVTSAG
jgi:hypothetical protein